MDYAAFDSTEACFYGTCWAIAFAAAIARTLRDGDYCSHLHSVSVGLVSGFLASAVVAFVVGNPDNLSGYEFRYLALAALIGLLGPEQDDVLRAVVWGGLKRFNIERIEHHTKSHELPPVQDKPKEPEETI